MFIDTLSSPFYDHMIGNVSSNFADIIVIGERVEVGLKHGKITHGPSVGSQVKKPYRKKKEGETYATSSAPLWETHDQPRYKNHQQHTTQLPYVANTMPTYQALNSYQARPVRDNTYQPKQIWKNDVSQGQNAKKNFVHFTPLLVTYTELLSDLLHHKLVAICPATSLSQKL